MEILAVVAPSTITITLTPAEADIILRDITQLDISKYQVITQTLIEILKQVSAGPV